MTNAAVLARKLNKGKDSVEFILRRYPTATFANGEVTFHYWKMKLVLTPRGWKAVEL